jgi:ATP-dependent Clp protease ATP-binding subunit ClpA
MSDEHSATSLPWTPRVKQDLATAQKLARANGLNYVGTEHVFLALLSGENTAVRNLLWSAGYAPTDLFKRVENEWAEMRKVPAPEKTTNEEVAALLRRAADLLSPQ